MAAIFFAVMVVGLVLMAIAGIVVAHAGEALSPGPRLSLEPFEVEPGTLRIISHEHGIEFGGASGLVAAEQRRALLNAVYRAGYEDGTRDAAIIAAIQG